MPIPKALKFEVYNSITQQNLLANANAMAEDILNDYNSAAEDLENEEAEYTENDQVFLLTNYIGLIHLGKADELEPDPEPFFERFGFSKQDVIDFHADLTNPQYDWDALEKEAAKETSHPIPQELREATERLFKNKAPFIESIFKGSQNKTERHADISGLNDEEKNAYYRDVAYTIYGNFLMDNNIVDGKGVDRLDPHRYYRSLELSFVEVEELQNELGLQYHAQYVNSKAPQEDVKEDEKEEVKEDEGPGINLSEEELDNMEKELEKRDEEERRQREERLKSQKENDIQREQEQLNVERKTAPTMQSVLQATEARIAQLREQPSFTLDNNQFNNNVRNMNVFLHTKPEHLSQTLETQSDNLTEYLTDMYFMMRQPQKIENLKSVSDYYDSKKLLSLLPGKKEIIDLFDSIEHPELKNVAPTEISDDLKSAVNSLTTVKAKRDHFGYSEISFKVATEGILDSEKSGAELMASEQGKKDAADLLYYQYVYENKLGYLKKEDGSPAFEPINENNLRMAYKKLGITAEQAKDFYSELAAADWQKQIDAKNARLEQQRNAENERKAENEARRHCSYEKQILDEGKNLPIEPKTAYNYIRDRANQLKEAATGTGTAAVTIEKNALLGMYALLRHQYETRKAAPKQSIGERISAFFTGIKENWRLGKMEKRLNELGVDSQTLHVEYNKAKNTLDFTKHPVEVKAPVEPDRQKMEIGEEELSKNAEAEINKDFLLENEKEMNKEADVIKQDELSAN